MPAPTQTVSVFYTFTPALPGGSIQIDDATSAADAATKAAAVVATRKAGLGADALDAAETFLTT